MPAKIAIIAALPREIAALVRGISPDDGLRTRGIFLYRLPGAVVIAAGMGALRATLAVKTALEDAPGATLISVGLAGGCAPGLAPGAVAEVAVVVDARTGERYGSSALSSGPVLVTVDSVAGVEEKARLAATYGASLVDMEAATVARLAAANGLRFRAIKAVSDAQDFELASLTQFTGRHGSFRTAAFALHIALRPHRWWKTAQLGRDSQRALAALTLKLRQVLQAEQG